MAGSVAAAVVAGDCRDHGAAGAATVLAELKMKVVVGRVGELLPVVPNAGLGDRPQVIADCVQGNRPPKRDLSPEGHGVAGVVAVVAGVGMGFLLEQCVEWALEETVHRAAQQVAQLDHFIQHLHACIGVVDVIGVTDQGVVVFAAFDEVIESFAWMGARQREEVQIGSLSAVVAADGSGEIRGAAVEDHKIGLLAVLGAGGSDEAHQGLSQSLSGVEGWHQETALACHESVPLACTLNLF